LNNTAILVFANSAKAEMQIKPIRKGAVLFDKLTQETLQKVKKTGLPYFHISEQEQKGKTFGERFTKAIQTVFENGHIFSKPAMLCKQEKQCLGHP